MIDYEINVRFVELGKEINQIKDGVDHLIKVLKPEDDLWDNSDMIRNWKVSERTLAEWRQKGLITFVRVKGKIWYPKKERNQFLEKHLVYRRTSHE
jgi:hypothetical protein